jgi:hypothetical protein
MLVQNQTDASRLVNWTACVNAPSRQSQSLHAIKCGGPCNRVLDVDGSKRTLSCGYVWSRVAVTVDGIYVLSCVTVTVDGIYVWSCVRVTVDGIYVLSCVRVTVDGIYVWSCVAVTVDGIYVWSCVAVTVDGIYWSLSGS